MTKRANKKQITWTKDAHAKFMRSWLGDEYEDLLVMDGFDSCIEGVCHRFGMDPVVIYDESKVLQQHLDGGMTHDEAVEYFDYNQLGAWMGDKTPAFLIRPPTELRRPRKPCFWLRPRGRTGCSVLCDHKGRCRPATPPEVYFHQQAKTMLDNCVAAVHKVAASTPDTSWLSPVLQELRKLRVE